MKPELNIEESTTAVVCSEKLGLRAYHGDDEAVRALLALERVIDGLFVQVSCPEHNLSHAVPVGAFVLGRGILL